jgi:hypothetical protein
MSRLMVLRAGRFEHLDRSWLALEIDDEARILPGMVLKLVGSRRSVTVRSLATSHAVDRQMVVVDHPDFDIQQFSGQRVEVLADQGVLGTG